MKKYLSSFILTGLLGLSYPNASAATIIKDCAQDFKEFAQIVHKHKQSNPKLNTVCFVDLDDTTLRYPGYIGTEKWFGDVINGLNKNGIKDAISDMFLAALTVHDLMRDKVTLTENSVVGIYNCMQNMLGIPVVGLTSRTYILSEATKAQLDHLGIKFSMPWNDQILLNNDEIWRAIYQPEEGVIYCSGKNKGDILVSLLAKTKSLCKFDTNQSQPQKIDAVIVFDNDIKHLDRIQAALEQNNIDIKLIRVLYNNPATPNNTQSTSISSFLDFQARLSKNSKINRLVSFFETNIPARQSEEQRSRPLFYAEA